MSSQVDVLHICRLPPFATGSFNRFVGGLVARQGRLRHASVSLWPDAVPAGADVPAGVHLVGGGTPALGRRALLAMPERVRARFTGGVADGGTLRHLWGTLDLLPKLRPAVVVCWDNHKFGRLLREAIDWPCRLVLAQRGLTYNLPTEQAKRLYSLGAFDVVWQQSRAAYRYDRQRLTAYEPAVTIIPNGVDADAFAPVSSAERRRRRASLGLPLDGRVVLCLSRLVPKKGVHLLVRAWPEVLRAAPDAILWVVGAGTPAYERSLREAVEALGIGHAVRFQGKVAHSDTAACYQAADVYAFPTLCTEGMANTMLEAMATGVACVASDHAAAREHFAGSPAVLVRDPNVDGAFVRPLVRLLTDDALRARRGASGRTFVCTRYPMAGMFDAVDALLQREVALAGRVLPPSVAAAAEPAPALAGATEAW